MQDFLPDYFRYIIMNPTTHLSPILGAFSMNLIKGDDKLPIYFTIQRNVNHFDQSHLEFDDLAFSFDIKGTMNGRKALKNPREIIDFDLVTQNKDLYCYRSLKDQDFLQSFKKLDITRSQAESIISQLENDVELLSKHGLMDYSLYIHIVLKPFKNVDYFMLKKAQKSNSILSEDKVQSIQMDYLSHKRIFIGEIDTDSNHHHHHGHHGIDYETLLVKE